MKRYSYLLFMTTFLVTGLNGYTHTFINEMDVPVQVKATYASLLCSNNEFTLNPGEHKVINAGICTLSRIDASVPQGGFGSMNKSGWIGVRSADYTGSADFHIFSGMSKKRLAIVRKGENDALDKF